MKNVGELQARLSTYERALRNLSVERRELDRNQALLERDKERRETERKELSLKDENNRKIEVYKAYAQYMYTTLLSLRKRKTKPGRNLSKLLTKSSRASITVVSLSVLMRSTTFRLLLMSLKVLMRMLRHLQLRVFRLSLHLLPALSKWLVRVRIPKMRCLCLSLTRL